MTNTRINIQPIQAINIINHDGHDGDGWYLAESQHFNSWSLPYWEVYLGQGQTKNLHRRVPALHHHLHHQIQVLPFNASMILLHDHSQWTQFPMFEYTIKIMPERSWRQPILLRTLHGSISSLDSLLRTDQPLQQPFLDQALHLLVLVLYLARQESDVRAGNNCIIYWFQQSYPQRRI